jgi:hypothetical protein
MCGSDGCCGSDRNVNQTPFPPTPADVAVLTVQEFTLDLDEFDGHGIPSMERMAEMLIGV